jgi:hypothetical protein
VSATIVYIFKPIAFHFKKGYTINFFQGFLMIAVPVSKKA